jgi:hypothetical protein
MYYHHHVFIHCFAGFAQGLETLGPGLKAKADGMFGDSARGWI